MIQPGKQHNNDNLNEYYLCVMKRVNFSFKKTHTNYQNAVFKYVFYTMTGWNTNKCVLLVMLITDYIHKLILFAFN
jgi:hypothetical protein